MAEELDEKLYHYSKSDYYPFHMPGHKRVSIQESGLYSIDITEIEGFDNLHSADGILREAQQRAAELYGSKKSYYLVNGGTCGLLAAVSAAVKPRGKILIARNVHKAVYHAIYLRQLSTAYLNPMLTDFGVQGAIDADEVRQKLEQEKEIGAVLITSPTYEGITSNVAEIAEIAHSHGIPLIVDEAHGAHFGFHPDFPQTAVRLGADIVVQSMHKVLPSLTQTALLHVNSCYVTSEKIENFLDIYETSSPSYVLMAGMERCVRLLREEGVRLFQEYARLLSDFYKKTEKFQHIHIMRRSDFSGKEIYGLDPSKLVISAEQTGLNGQELYELLLNQYHLQMEMASGHYVLGMTSIMDSKEGMDRLYQALKEIDAQNPDIAYSSANRENKEFVRRFYKPRKKRMEVYQAMELPAASVRFKEAIGKISAVCVCLYPPGIPVLLPGEEIDEDFIKNIRKCLRLRLNLQGIADIINERINVVNF